MKKIEKILLSSLFFTLITVLTQRNVFAQYDPCNPEKTMYDRSLLSEALGIPLTTKDFMSSTVTSIYSSATGFGVTESMGCQAYFNGGTGCSGTAEAVCADMANSQNYSVPVGGAYNGQWFADFGQRRVSGTLLGAVYLTENFNKYEPLPANLAFYVNDTISRVPIIGKTYAAQTTNFRYGHAMLDAILGIWKVSRNIAYGLMAIIMLYTGIVIILRRRISSQVVVSVQYALPRIVIAIFLITFSYPIGATLGSFSWTLFRSGNRIVTSLLASANQGGITGDVGGQTWWTIVLNVFAGIVGGVVFIAALTVITILSFLILLVFNIKAIIIYIKIIFSIITAPLEFALGAVPGNDDKIKAWFLRMAKYLLTLLLMGMVYHLSLGIGSYLTTSAAGEMGGLGFLLTSVFPLFFVVYGFGLGIGMEKKVDEFLGTGQQKRR